jgi:SAM-dependent methyltransferase
MAGFLDVVRQFTLALVVFCTHAVARLHPAAGEQPSNADSSADVAKFTYPGLPLRRLREEREVLSMALWDEWIGRKITWRLQRRILPHLRWNQEIWGEMVRLNLTGFVRWLDSGCGWRLLGKDLEPLENEMVSRTRLAVGVDLDFPHLRKHLNLSRRVCGALGSLPFSDASFDLVTCNMVVEHLPAPLPIFQEMSRVLAPGGTLMVHTPNTRNYLVFANILVKKLLPRSLGLKLVNDGRAGDDIYPTYYRANNVHALRKLGESVKLQPESVRFLTQPQPYSRFFAPAAFFELLLMRATMTRPFDRFGATIVVVFRKHVDKAAGVARAA